MAVNYNFKKGIDVPVWLWEPMFPPGIGYHGASTAYDGSRYLYVAEQYGSTGTTASTTALYRFDTWSLSWQYLTLLTSGNQGLDMEYDSIRNVLYILTGASTTTWQVFNLNNTAVTIANVVCAAFTLTTMTLVLPAAAPLGSSFTMPSDDAVPAQVDSGTEATGGGANTFYPAQYAPYQLIAVRGSATSTYYMYNIGTNDWTTPTVFASGQTFTTGSAADMVSGKRKIIFLKESTNQLYILDLLTGVLEPAGYLPYVAPGAYDGKRLRVVTTPDGAQFLYVRRAAGPEFYRLALEWL